jgi:hypothetical protein
VSTVRPTIRPALGEDANLAGYPRRGTLDAVGRSQYRGFPLTVNVLRDSPGVVSGPPVAKRASFVDFGIRSRYKTKPPQRLSSCK